MSLRVVSYSRLKVVATLLLLFLLVPIQVTSNASQSSRALSQSSAATYSSYALSALNPTDRITLGLLKSSTGNSITVASYESYIENNLAPYDIRKVLLNIGWGNYSVGTMPDEDWVSNWLTACDVMGIQNVLYVGQLTTSGVGSPWIKSVIAMDPTTQTYSSNGSAVAFVSYNNPDVALFLEKDLSIIYSYYGSHPSWIGIGTGSSGNDPYYQSGQLFPGLGYSNLSISNFVNSGFYSSDVNGTGFLPSGQMDPLWTSYRNVQPSILLSSGTGFLTSSPANVYGNGSLSNYVEMRFNLPVNVSSLGVSWYGSAVGSPGPMVVTLYADVNGSLDSSSQLAIYEVPASSYTNETGWQTGPSVPINMTSGYYWVTFSSPSSNSGNYYQVYVKNSLIDNATAYAQETYVGPGFQHVSTILWLKDQFGRSVSLYPYQQLVVQPPPIQSIVATSSYAFNTIFLYLSDRIYNPTNGTLTITDMSENNKTLATGIFSQQLLHGTETWVPINLNATITTIPGHVYLMSVSEPNGGYSWRVVLRGMSTDPSSAGFQGQGSSWLFQVANLNWVQGNLDFMDMTTNGADAVTSGHLDAVRIMPSSNETMTAVSILMASNTQSGNYTSGELSISVWNSTATGLTPSSPLSLSVTIPAKEVPANGWLNVTGFNQSVIGGRYYWVAFSADSNESFSMARFTGVYAFDVQVSLNGGTKWQEPREGPTEFGFVVSLSNQKIGNFVSERPEVQIDPTGYFAEPFYASQTTQVSGVFLGPVGGCISSVSINPDTKSSHPSLSPIASGVFNAPEFVQFSSVAKLQAGQKYWLVIHPISGTCKVFPLVYLPNAPNIPSYVLSILSQNGGLTWDKISNSSSSLVYELASPGVQLPEFDTAELAGYLSAYHSPSVSEGIIHGWTGYIAASRLSLFGQITNWLNNETGKEFLFYGSGQPNVLNELPVKSEILLPVSLSSNTCSGLASELNAEMPIADVQYYNVADSSLLAACSGTTLGPVLQQLGYMLGTGESYGQSSPTKVLVVGDAMADNLTRYLSIAFNTTYSQLSLDPTLKGEGNLSKYTAIVWTSSKSPFATLESQVARYVKEGGSFILAQFGGNKSSFNSMLASLPNSNTSLPLPGPAYLTSLVAHTSYENLSVESSSTETRGDSPVVSIITHSYGKGRFYLDWFSITEPSQASDPTVLLSNTIARSDALPEPFWYAAGSTPPNAAVEFNVRETGSGPILVWLANTGDRNVTFSLHLNGSYYGIASNWKALNMNDMDVSTGSGSDVVLGGNLAAESWLPIFIVGYSSAALIDYSSVQVSGQFVYPHQSLYELSPVKGQEALILVSSNTTATQVLVDDSPTLPNLHSADAFSSALNGWAYYNSSSTLMIKFATDGTSKLRVLTYTGPSQAPAVPVRTLFAVVVALVCVEAVVLVSVYVRRTRHYAPDEALR